MSVRSVLLAPDKFKGSLGAAQVARHVMAGLGAAAPTVPAVSLPVADGGEGTVAAALAAGFRRVPVSAAGPTGQPVTASLALRGELAVVELAEAAGLRRLPGGRPAPLTATSAGVGHMIAAAARLGARRIVLGLGGSACTDGGTGMVRALGARVLDAAGGELPEGGSALRDVARVDRSGLPRLPPVVLASDVDNPLLGPNGAAAVYGPQKGASAADVRTLEAGLRRWAAVVGFPDGPGAGAAGGVGYAAQAFLGARTRSGVGVVLELLGFAEAVATARLVVTGEGALDEQTLHGKAPAGVAAAARAAGVPVVAVAGRCELTSRQIEALGLAAVYPLTDLEPDPARCVANAGPLLRRVAARIARDWLTEGDMP
jgi:glycerate kinase